MRRRSGGLAVVALTVVVMLCSSCALVTSRPTPRIPDRRPNIVFVLTDDLSWNLMQYMPHVRALMRAGTTMSRYYVVDSLCCPSRAALLTGEFLHNNHVLGNAGKAGGFPAFNRHGDQDQTFGLALQRSGYRTGFMGKYLNGYQPSDPPQKGWNTWDVTGYGYPEFNYVLNSDGHRHHYGRKPKDYLTDVISHRAGTFVTQSAKSGKPFMLEVATFAPHAPYTPAPRFAHAYKNLRYPRTAAYDTLPRNAPQWLSYRPPLSTTQQAVIRHDFRLRVQADLATDQMIGHLERKLVAAGVAQNTYFVFSSDNGLHMGEYRLLPGKQTAYETDIHVPLVVTGPGVPAGRTVSRLASSIDLAPTFENIAQTPVGGSVDGVSLDRLWHGAQPPRWQQAVLIEHRGYNHRPDDPDAQSVAAADPPSYEAVRTLNALYVRYSNGHQEYYDTARDPYELHNLAPHIPARLPHTLNELEHCQGALACQAAAQPAP